MVSPMWLLTKPWTGWARSKFPADLDCFLKTIPLGNELSTTAENNNKMYRYRLQADDFC